MERRPQNEGVRFPEEDGAGLSDPASPSLQHVATDPLLRPSDGKCQPERMLGLTPSGPERRGVGTPSPGQTTPGFCSG